MCLAESGGPDGWRGFAWFPPFWQGATSSIPLLVRGAAACGVPSEHQPGMGGVAGTTASPASLLGLNVGYREEEEGVEGMEVAM